MTKILWVANTIFPDAAINLGIPPPVYGGWMYGLASDLAKSTEIKLAVATVYSGKSIRAFSKNGIHYYLLPEKCIKINKRSSIDHWSAIVQDFLPDLIHIHGTESAHGMALMNACPGLKYVVSIQGLVSVIHRYFFAGISTWDVLRNITLRDILRWDTLFHARRSFYKRGLLEVKYIQRAIAIIGRTDWDRAHTLAINQKTVYHFCNESLRDEFYTDEKWSLENCRKHSIFLSQAGYPIKGLHQVLKAVALLKDDYPDILVEIAGDNITMATTLKDRLKRSGYGRYIGRMIKDYGLVKHIRFLGPLQAEEMKKSYLRAHVFICPSSIENSPNSLGEAQILGVPCIATYSGGIPSMTNNGEGAVLYRFEEHEMLAHYCANIFRNSAYSIESSSTLRKIAQSRHDRKNNLNSLLNIYKDIK